MIVGQNEKLETVLKLMADNESPVDRDDVLTVIVNSVAVGDIWTVPVDPLDDDTEAEDYPEGMLLEKIPVFVKKTLVTGKDKRFFCAFTSTEKIETDGAELPVMSVT